MSSIRRDERFAPQDDVGDASECAMRASCSLASALSAPQPPRARPWRNSIAARPSRCMSAPAPGGGAVSAYPMALAPVIRKYIPGNPNVVVSHMPGAGGIKAATFIESVGAAGRHRLGLHHPRLHAGAAAQAAAGEFPADANSTGSAAPRAPSRWAWCGTRSTPVRTIQEAMQKEVVVGATSIAQDTGIFPRALNRVARHQVQDRHRLCRPRRGRHRDGARRGAGQGRLDLEVAQQRPERALGARTRSSP